MDGGGLGGGSDVSGYLGSGLVQPGNPTALFGFPAIPDFTGGVTISGNGLPFDQNLYAAISEIQPKASEVIQSLHLGGAFNFSVQATDANGCQGARVYSLTITPPCATITVNPNTLSGGATGAGYNQTLTASGGAAPYSFTLSAGALPTGLSLAANGALSGTPTVAGSFNFAAQATDANSCQGTRAYTLTIGSSACDFSVTPAGHAFSSEGGSGLVNVNAAGGCVWTAESDDPMITITAGANGAGAGVVKFEVSTNPTGPTKLAKYHEIKVYGSGDRIPLLIDGHEIGQIAVREILP